MKYAHVFALALAVALQGAPAWAQHGHPGGMGRGAANSMNHDTADHGAANASHGQTMNDILARDTQLASKIQTLTGMNAQQACAGFKNLGQCVAAAHVSHNLHISFACLQADMTGTAAAKGTSCPTGTGTKSMSLGKAIQALSPHADSKSEAKKATQQADQDIKASNA